MTFRSTEKHMLLLLSLFEHWNLKFNFYWWRNIVIHWWVSEWLLLNAKRSLLQLYHGANKLQFDEMMALAALYQTNTLRWLFIVLADWNISPRGNISLLCDTFSRFWSQPFFVLFPWFCMRSRDATNTNITVVGFIRLMFKPMNNSFEESTWTITPSKRFTASNYVLCIFKRL